jgi:MGT family glycosyltransferase
MSKILFVNANLYGHINPTLALVEELVKRGNQVCYFCSHQFEDSVRSTGAEFLDYSSNLDKFLSEYHPTDRHPFFMLMEYVLQYDEVMLPDILTHIRENQYDVVICDSIFGGAYFLQQILGIPVVCSHSSFAMSKAPIPPSMLQPGFHPQLDHCYLILRRLCDKYGIMEPGLDQLFVSKGDLNVVYTTREFNGEENLEESRYLFTGPSLRSQEKLDEVDFSLAGDRQIVYISLGSLNTDFIEFYRMCIQAFQEAEYFIIMSIGRKCEITQLGPIPSHFLVQNFLPQLEILKKASVFISHAGFNSVSEALYYGVPMLALPLVNDQHMIAKRLTELGLGIVGTLKELTPQSLRQSVEELLDNHVIREKCSHMSQGMREVGRLAKAAERIERFTSHGKGGNNGDKE